ncbi:MAG: hypothetical protein FD187_2365 [bacterium]|nr:MAG: hypothetical protein FD142_1008 [bacterium]KAF0147934.1 MAG: hypothetical protein FD187_2365 [bacterium]KAF0168116.1 MAG: hypothetical protein FD158_1664 [bacterium]TXT22575.1 MAG: hypothetical protein FD132_385 [bacterium]
MRQFFPATDADLDRAVNGVLIALLELTPEEAVSLLLVLSRNLAVEVREPTVAERLAVEYEHLAARLRLPHCPVAGHA